MFAILLFVVAVSAFPCPSPLSIQDPNLASAFNLSQFLGAGLPYYELALHDYTQPSLCGCMRSAKTLPVPGAAYIHDNFTMICPWNISNVTGKIYISDLSFIPLSSPEA